jgi:hypothetical protein
MEEVELTDNESEEEDEESELSKNMTIMPSNQSLTENKNTDQLTKDWTAPIYAFFKPTPIVEYVDGCHCHTFQCTARTCKCKSRGIQRFLDKGDTKSMSNMCKHAKKCWGDNIVASVDNAENVNDVHCTTIKGFLNPQSITRERAK